MRNLLRKELPANINNTNNNNNTNDTNNKINNTTLVWSVDHSKVMSNETSSPPLGKPIEEKESLDSCSQERGVKRLPAAWRGVKFDLFCNGSNRDGSAMLKLNVGVIRKIDGSAVPLQASLNSTFDDAVRRGVDKMDWNNSSHWIRVKQHRKELEYLYQIRASKVGLKQKGGGTEIVAFVFQDQTNTWCVDIIHESQIYHYILDGELTESQSSNNTIATAYIGQRAQKKLITAKELGI